MSTTPTMWGYVNPARAGMIRHSQCELEHGRFLLGVNPARAGMIPTQSVKRVFDHSKPRASGDDPGTIPLPYRTKV